jgi:hypothetical protein
MRARHRVSAHDDLHREMDKHPIPHAHDKAGRHENAHGKLLALVSTEALSRLVRARGMAGLRESVRVAAAIFLQRSEPHYRDYVHAH